MKKRIYFKSISLIILFVTGFIISCDLPSQNPNEEGEAKQQILENADLFRYKDGAYFFDVNDSKYLSKYGSTYLTITEEIESEKSFESYTTKIIKTSGNLTYPYGVIFNYALNDENITSMLCVMISADGYYLIGKIINGIYYEIIEETYNMAIKTGLGNINSLNISYNSAEKYYVVTFNGNTDNSVTFKDEKGDIFASGSRGYVVTLSPNENFPDTSVKVSFTKS